MTDISIESPNDILLWPNGDWIYRSRLGDPEFDIDDEGKDFTILRQGQPEYTRHLAVVSFRKRYSSSVPSLKLTTHIDLSGSTVQEWERMSREALELRLPKELSAYVRAFHNVTGSSSTLSSQVQRDRAELLKWEFLLAIENLAPIEDQTLLLRALLTIDLVERRRLLQRISDPLVVPHAQALLQSTRRQDDVVRLKHLQAFSPTTVLVPGVLNGERMYAAKLMTASLKAGDIDTAKRAGLHMYLAGVLMVAKRDASIDRASMERDLDILKKMAADMRGIAYTSHGKLLRQRGFEPDLLSLTKTDYRNLDKIFGTPTLAFRPFSHLVAGFWPAQGEPIVIPVLHEMLPLIEVGLDWRDLCEAGDLARAVLHQAELRGDRESAVLAANRIYQVAVVHSVLQDIVAAVYLDGKEGEIGLIEATVAELDNMSDEEMFCAYDRESDARDVMRSTVEKNRQRRMDSLERLLMYISSLGYRTHGAIIDCNGRVAASLEEGDLKSFKKLFGVSVLGFTPFAVVEDSLVDWPTKGTP